MPDNICTMEISGLFKESEEKKDIPLLEEEDIKDFLELREIKKEDQEMIEKFGVFPQKFFIEFHDLFNTIRSSKYQIQGLEGNIKELEKKHEQEDDEKRMDEIAEEIEFQKLLITFLKKYDPIALIHLMRVFEERNKNT